MKNSFKQENLKSLFRNSSPNLLKQYFETQRLLNDVDLEEEKKKRKLEGFIDFLIEEIEKIEPYSRKNQVKSELHKIYLMRNGKNILECIRDGGLTDYLIDEIRKEKNNYNQSLILFLKDKANFDEFYLVYDVNILNRHNHWGSARTDYLTEDKEIDDNLVENLLENAKEHLKKDAMCNKFCKKRITFGDKEYIFGFYEELPQEQLKIEDDNIESYFSSPVGKVVFFYDKRHKFVKIYGEDRAVRQKMHKSFAKVVFNKENITDEQEKNEVYDLQSIFDQLVVGNEINFNINSANIKKIIPTSIRLQNKLTKEKLEISLSKNVSDNDLVEAIKKYISFDNSKKNLVSYDELETLWASFQIHYQDQFDSKKIVKKTITITNRNNINNLGQEDIDFDIMDCLKGSGILKQKEDND